MYCKSCGEPMQDNQAVCTRCGTKKGEGNAYCANCGQPLQPGADVCLTCGVSVKKNDQLAGQDKIILAFVCFILGGLVIHCFMMGETKKGIVRIVASFCCGIGAIIALIDFIRILTDSYVVDPDAYF